MELSSTLIAFLGLQTTAARTLEDRRGSRLVAAANPAYNEPDKSATVRVAASVVVAAIVVPLVTAWRRQSGLAVGR
jgi:hypothetical protein